MKHQVMQEKLKAIHDEALELAKRDDLSDEVEEGLNRIVLLSRSEVGRRDEQEKPVSDPDRV